MKPLAEAQREILAAMQPLPVVEVPLSDALGLVLSESVVATSAVPAFDNSAVDGFAVRSEDVATVPTTLSVIETVPAGTVAHSAVSAGTAIRIMTGAPMPRGADAVVMVEDTETKAGDRVVIGRMVGSGAHVRRAGGDLEAGALVFEAGERLSPAHLGVLATIGVASPRVRRRPRVVVVSTGDEMVPASAADLAIGKVRDSNGPMLTALLREFGAEVADAVIVGDDDDAIRRVIAGAAAEADMVITTGGVSMGDLDRVKAVLSGLGTIDFWQVAIQPAKPFVFGFVGTTPLFGLPGNPVSAFVAFEQLVRPALLRRMGATKLFRPRTRARLDEAVTTDPAKTVFLRMVVSHVESDPVARRAGSQVSNVLSVMAAADAFGVVAQGTADLAAGEMIVLEWFRSPETRTAEEALR